MDVDEERPGTAARAGNDEEIEELKFLVGTSCSRLINLLMDGGASRAELAAEAAFMAARAARLAELLEPTVADPGHPHGGAGADSGGAPQAPS